MLVASSGAGRVAVGQIFGYMPEAYSVGDNLFCNPLDGSGSSGGGNTLDDITVGNGFGNVVPDGTTVQPWDQTLGRYMPASTFSAASQTWSIRLTRCFREREQN